jgi:hypothetical protein
MNHNYVSDHNTADLYVMGKLSPDERERFEAHLISCEQCLDTLEEIQFVRQTLQGVGSAEAIRTSAYRVRGPARWFSQFDPSRQMAILGAAILLAILPIAALVLTVVQLRHQLKQASIASAPTIARPNTAEADHLVQSDRNQSRNGLAGVVTEPAKHGRVSDSGNLERLPTRRRNGRQSAPQVNTPIFVLTSLRQVSPVGPTSENELSLPAGATLFLISLELEGAPRYENYSVELLGESSTPIWKGDHLKPDQHDALSISFPTTFFKSGRYHLILERADREGKLKPIADYPFRVTKSK